MRYRDIKLLSRPAECAQLIEEIDLLRDVRTAIKQIDAGEIITNDDAKAELRRRLTAA